MNTDNLIGVRLANYLIESALGHGGMARVYKARDITLKRTVAIKVIAPDLSAQEKYRDSFEREAEAVAALEHPNIVPVYYFGKEQQLYYLAMKFIEGEDLSTLMSRYNAAGEYLPITDILSILEGITQALDYAHSNGVIHRDVKPSNILIDRQGHPYLTDFGLALNLRQGTIGDVFGTPHYIAPEQARSSAEAVPQSDLYSLGVVLYELFTGVVPFDDPNPTAIAIQHLTKEPPPPRSLNPDLSPHIEAVILKALSKAPEDRYSTGSSLLESLRAALQNTARPREASEIPSLPPLPPGVEAPPPRQHSARSVSAEVRASLAQRAAIESSLLAAATQGIHSPLPTQRTETQANVSKPTMSDKPVSWTIPLIALAAVIIGVIAIVAIVASTLNNQNPTTVAEIPTTTLTASPEATNTDIPASATSESVALALAEATATLTDTDTSVPPTLEPTSAPPTEQPSATPEPPSATPTSEPPTNEPTIEPSATPTSEPPSATPIPPSATPTSEPPSATFTNVPPTAEPTTAALLPTDVPTDSGPSEPTSAPDDWLPVTFVYNNTTFYWINHSQQDMLVSPIAFERANGEDRFEGWRWTQFFSRVEDGSCVQVMAFNSRQMMPRPADCQRINASMAANSNEGFWTGQRGRFRVFWNDVEVAVCEIAAGQCDAALPPR